MTKTSMTGPELEIFTKEWNETTAVLRNSSVKWSKIPIVGLTRTGGKVSGNAPYKRVY
jgi:hypothetical protein